MIKREKPFLLGLFSSSSAWMSKQSNVFMQACNNFMHAYMQ